DRLLAHRRAAPHLHRADASPGRRPRRDERLSMSAERIDGRAFAEGLRGRVAAAVPAFAQATGRNPGLAVVLVGEDPASQIYVRSKHKATLEAGMESFEHRLPDTTSQDELVAL